MDLSAIIHRMSEEEKRCFRGALYAKISVLLEARRRINEAVSPAVVHEDAAQPSDDGDDDGQQLAAGAGSSSSGNVVASLHDGDPAVATTADDDDFYPLDDPHQEYYSTELDDDDARWGRHLLGELYDAMGIGTAGLHDTDQEAGESGHNGDVQLPDSADPTYGDDDYDGHISRYHLHQAIFSRRLHIPHIAATPAVFDESARNNNNGGGGFGGVPASASAIAGLRKHKYDGSGDGTRCVICMRDYKKGKSLVVMPCEYAHRFHRKCLKKWLSRSHLCPLCRHALPTEEVRRSKRIRGGAQINVSV